MDGELRLGTLIYMLCDDEYTILFDESNAKRAECMVGNYRDYNLLIDNCHQFTSGCITGNFENSDNFTLFLKQRISEYMNNGDEVRLCRWYGDYYKL